MAKRIVAKTGTYQKDGQDKGEYTNLGVILNNDNGEYILMDPCVNLAGVLIKQNVLAAKSGGQQRDMVMISIFEDDNKSQRNNQQAAPQQQGNYQPAPQQNGFNQNAPQQQQGQQQNQHKYVPPQQMAGAPVNQGGFYQGK